MAILKFNKDNLKRKNYKINYEVLLDFFELKYYYIIFMIATLIILFLLNVVIIGSYFMFIVLGSVSAFLNLNIYSVSFYRLYFYLQGF